MNPELLGKGYVQVYTGNGKGKTTAAMGLAFRAMGRGLKTYIGQFAKGQHYSELESAKITPYITIEQYGQKEFLHLMDSGPTEEYIQMARKGLKKAKEAMLSGEYDIIIFDEINVANKYNLISTEEMLDIIKNKPDGVEIIFTGRNAPLEVIEAANLVTEMVEVKHYYKQGVKSRRGIER